MKKKIIIFSLAVVLVGLIFLVDKIDESNLFNRTGSITSKILEIDNKHVTLKKDDVTYIFLLDDTTNLEIGDSIKLEYKGSLNSENNIQDVDIIKYEILETVKEVVILDDNGIFSDYYKVATNKLTTMSLDEKIGQVLLARVPENKQIEDLVTYKFGGYLLFKRDFQDKTKDEVIKMIKSYQENTGIPLLIAADEEGGTVTRISRNTNLVSEPFKSPRELYLQGGLNLIKEDTINKSKIMSSLGLNLNLAPVVDVSLNKNDFIYSRTLGENATLTSEFATTVINSSKGLGVSYTLKHFPGYGNNSDTHKGMSVDTRLYSDIMNNDIKPFKAGIDAGCEAILVSHNIVTSIDSELPSSLSKNVHDVLRNDLGFTGIIITDDLSMAAIGTNYENPVLKAIKAGNDILIVTDYKESFNEIKNSLEKNELTEDELDKIVVRILAWKYYKGLLKNK